MVRVGWAEGMFAIKIMEELQLLIKTRSRL